MLACASLAILFFNLSVPPFAPFNFGGGNSARDEAAIDVALQDAVKDALANRDGTVIVMDAHTGRIRAIVNADAAYSQAMMPGSAIKPFTALAALRAGLIDEDSRAVCPGRFTGLNFSLPCVHADHLPPFNPSQAIAYSCNYYFATQGQRLGRDNLVATLREFGFGQRTGFSESEAAGMVRPCEMGGSARVMRGTEADHASMQADCNAREAIGESANLQVTPIQLLTAYAALVNGGHLYEPRIASAIDYVPAERARINIAEEHRTIISEGMAGAIRYGTARTAKLDSLPLTIIGKTGTANPPQGFRTNGWFIGFAAPFSSKREIEPSQIDLAVLVLLPRAHGSQAAAIARPIFAAYANEISHRSTESQGNKTPESQGGNPELAGSPRLSVSAPATIKVHLVRDSLTQELSLEDYVLGVMRAEGTMETEPEALKALAIAIRSYTVRNLGRHAKDGYDFCSTTHCQRFVKDGSLADGQVSALLVAAVRATDGQVLLDDRGQVIDSYFGASCGGETANIGELWGVTPPEYLRGVRDEYCESGPHANWTDTITRADLLRALQSDSRTDVGSRLESISISKRDETGRAEFMTLEGEHRKTVRGWDFKIIVGRVLGWNILKSSRFEISQSGSNFIFRGTGFGHGLGLCQEGAHGMAARGANYQKILEKYFPRTSLGNRNGSSVSWIHLTTEGPQESAERAEEYLRSPQRIPLRSLRLMSFAHHAVQKQTLSLSSEHFRVAYPTDIDRRDVNQVLNTLESARSDYLRRASAAVSLDVPTLEIRLSESTGDFTSRTGQPWWAAAATKGNRIELQPLKILKQRGVLFTTLRHELAHVVIDAVSHNHAARWLAEGLAIHLAGEGGNLRQYQKSSRYSQDELEKRLERPSSQAEMRVLYAQAYLAVAEMIRTQGEANVWKKLAGS